MLVEAIYALLLWAVVLYPKLALVGVAIINIIMRMVTMMMSLLMRLGALCGVTVPLAVFANARNAGKWIGSRTRMPSRPSSACAAATTTFVGSAWNNYRSSSTWYGSRTPNGKRQRNDMYLPEPRLGSSYLSHSRPDIATEPRMSFSAAAVVMLKEYAELLDRAEREVALGVVSGEIGSLPFSAWGIAEEDELTGRLVLLAPGDGLPLDAQ